MDTRNLACAIALVTLAAAFAADERVEVPAVPATSPAVCPALDPQAAGHSVAKPTWRESLERPIDVDVVDLPFEDFLDHLTDLTGVPFVLDRPDLEQEGVNPKDLVTIRAKQLPARAMLELTGLPIALYDDAGAAVLTTEAKVQGRRDARVYDVTDLVVWVDANGNQPENPDDAVGSLRPDFGPLTDIVENQAGGPPFGPWQSIDGEGGSLSSLERDGRALFVIDQTQPVHLELEKLFAELRRHLPRRTPASTDGPRQSLAVTAVSQIGPDERVRTRRLYDVGDLVVRTNADGERIVEFDPLVRLLEEQTGGQPAAPWVNVDGEGGVISTLEMAGWRGLCVTQTEAAQQEVGQLLERLREARRVAGVGAPGEGGAALRGGGR